MVRRIILPAALFIFAPTLVAAAVTEDPRDRAYVQALVNRTLETQRTMVETQWSNPETGSKGVIVVERTNYKTPTMPCRDYYRTTVPTGGEPLRVRGSGCRVSPGSWQLDEQPPIAEAAAVTSRQSSAPRVGPPDAVAGSGRSPSSAPPTRMTRTPQSSPSVSASRPTSSSAPEPPPAAEKKKETRTARSKPPSPPAPPQPAPFPKFTLPSKAAL